MLMDAGESKRISSSLEEVTHERCCITVVWKKDKDLTKAYYPKTRLKWQNPLE